MTRPTLLNVHGHIDGIRWGYGRRPNESGAFKWSYDMLSDRMRIWCVEAWTDQGPVEIKDPATASAMRRLVRERLGLEAA